MVLSLADRRDCGQLHSDGWACFYSDKTNTTAPTLSPILAAFSSQEQGALPGPALHDLSLATDLAETTFLLGESERERERER